MSTSNLWPYNEIKTRRNVSPSFLLGRIEGTALALKASTDVNVSQAADMIINDVMALAETIDQKQSLPPITLPK